MDEPDHMMRVRLPAELHEKIRLASKANSRSVNSEITDRLTASFKEWTDGDASASNKSIRIARSPERMLSLLILTLGSYVTLLTSALRNQTSIPENALSAILGTTSAAEDAANDALEHAGFERHRPGNTKEERDLMVRLYDQYEQVMGAEKNVKTEATQPATPDRKTPGQLSLLPQPGDPSHDEPDEADDEKLY